MTAPIRSGDVDNVATYASFGVTYAVGHSLSAVARGDDPLVELPGWLPMTIFGAGLVISSILATVAAVRAQRGMPESEQLAGKLLGYAWVIGFAGLTLAINGLDAILGAPDLQTVLWPVGSAFVVGLVYLAEGAVRRNVLHFRLGAWLALMATAATFFGSPGLFWMLALAGGGAYAIGAVLERRRLAYALPVT